MTNNLSTSVQLNLVILGIACGCNGFIDNSLLAAQIEPASKQDNSAPSQPISPNYPIEPPQIESGTTVPDSPFDSQIEISQDTQKTLTGQVTSVSQLSDVQPTDWAFSALQSLIERYGCIAGYPDGTFRGNRALTRYEFAAGLNACLDQINQLITASTTNFVTKQDLVALQRLEEEFAAEIATLRGQVDILEARTAELEANQFSTTTKLSALTGFNLVGANAASGVKVERIDPEDPFSSAQRDANGKPTVTEVRNDPNTTMSYFTVISFLTSFTGDDSLVTSLAVGNGDSAANAFSSAGLYNTFGVPSFDITTSAGNNKLALLESYYSFPVNNSLELTVGPRLLWLSYFDTNAFTSIFGKGAGSYNSFGTTLMNDLGRGAGAVAKWKFNDKLKLHLGYMANVPGASQPNRGLFGSTRSFTAELTYSPSKNANIRLIYDRTRILPNDDGQISTRPIKGVADDGFGGKLEDAAANSFGLNFDWRLAANFGIFGRYTYSNTRLNPKASEMKDESVNAQSFQFGLGFPDLGKEGAIGALSFVVPFDVLSGRRFLVAGGGDGGTQYDIEASYYFPMTDNVAIVPSFYLIVNPNNFSSNPTIYVGSMRMQFEF